MEKIRSFLKQFPLYEEQEFEALLPHLTTKNLNKGEFLLRQGKTSRHIAFIEHGLMRLFYIREDREITNCFCKESTFITSFQSFLTGQKSDFAIQAVEPTKLILLSKDTLDTLYKRHVFWQQLGRVTAEKEYIERTCYQRFINDLSATERYEKVLKEESELLQRVPLRDLASYLQITPETLSRIRKDIAGN